MSVSMGVVACGKGCGVVAWPYQHRQRERTCRWESLVVKPISRKVVTTVEESMGLHGGKVPERQRQRTC